MIWPFKKRTEWKEHFDRGMAAGGAGDLRGALTHFRKAVRLAPLEPYPRYELGFTFFLLGEFEPALNELRATNELAEIALHAYAAERHEPSIMSQRSGSARV